MRSLLFLGGVAVLMGCEFLKPPEPSVEPFVELTILSPQPGETRNIVSYRVRLRGYSLARVAAASPRQPETVLASRTGCEGPPETCEGDLFFPVINTDVEVWAEYVDLSGTESRTPRQTVRVNSMPVVLAQLSRTPTRVSYLVTGQNNVDPTTLPNLKVTRSFAVTDHLMGSEDLSAFTATLRGNKLDVEGPFIGPASYRLDLSGVKNAFGTALPSQELDATYFSPVAGAPLVPAFPRTLSRLERGTDGALWLVHGLGVARLDKVNGVQEVTAWTAAHLGTVDRAGVPYRVLLATPTTVDVERWNGTAWAALPQVTVPMLTLPSEHRLELAFDAANTPFLMTAVCGQGSPGCGSVQVRRFDAAGPAWAQALSSTFARTTTWLELFAFGDSVALFFNERTTTGEFAYAPTMLRYAPSSGTFTSLPTPVGPHVGLIPFDFPILPGAVKSDARGHAYVIAGMAGFIDLDLMAILEWDGTAWSVLDDGTRAYFAHSTLGPMPRYVMDLSAMWVNAWDLTPSGEVAVFTWEQTGQGLDKVRFHAGAYLLSGSAWSVLPGVGSPLIASAERYQSVLYQSPREVWATTFLSGTTPSALVRHDH